MHLSSISFLAALIPGILAKSNTQSILARPRQVTRRGSYGGQEEWRLIETAQGERKWMSPDEVAALQSAAGLHHFMDITEHQHLDSIQTQASLPLPKSARLQTIIKPLFTQISIEFMRSHLETFTEFYTRFYKTKSGVESSEWLFKTIQDMTAGKEGATVRTFKHARWGQKSIIARIEGKNPKAPMVILSAHQDCVNGLFGRKRSPGADDDGSGTVTLLDVLRIHLENNISPYRPIEFHFYSAEEAGLLGSQDIASVYASKGAKILAQLQVDMDGYTGKQDVVGIVTDNVDPGVVTFLRTLVKTYVAIEFRETRCGYACSDHASWKKAGYPSGFITEAEMSKFSPYIHTANDTVDKIDFGHLLEFAKLSLSFIMELGAYEG